MEGGRDCAGARRYTYCGGSGGGQRGMCSKLSSSAIGWGRGYYLITTGAASSPPHVCQACILHPKPPLTLRFYGSVRCVELAYERAPRCASQPPKTIDIPTPRPTPDTVQISKPCRDIQLIWVLATPSSQILCPYFPNACPMHPSYRTRRSANRKTGKISHRSTKDKTKSNTRVLCKNLETTRFQNPSVLLLFFFDRPPCAPRSTWVAGNN